MSDQVGNPQTGLLTTKLIYCCRNIFCALCNGVVPSINTVFGFEKRWLSPSDIYSFSGLISFAQRDEQMVEPKTGCDSGLIFDVVKVNLDFIKNCRGGFPLNLLCAYNIVGSL